MILLGNWFTRQQPRRYYHKIIPLESQGGKMLFENVFFGIFSLLFLVTFEIGELAFFVILGILSIAVVVKIIKNKKKKSSAS